MISIRKNQWPAIRLAAILSICIIALLVVPNIEFSCSKSSVQDLTLSLELLRSEQEYNQSMLYLVNSIFEWEEVANDFSMHDDWTARKVRTNNRLSELSGSISDLQNQLDECN